MRAGLLLSLLVVFAVAGFANAQERSPTKETTDSSKKSGNWLTRWLPWGGKTEDKKNSADISTVAAPESAVIIRARELAALQRRQAVCLKLKEIAARTGDDMLALKAEQLDQLAWQVYEQRTRNGVVATGRLSTGDIGTGQSLGANRLPKEFER